MPKTIDLNALTNDQRNALIIQIDAENDLKKASNNELMERLNAFSKVLPDERGKQLMHIANTWSDVMNKIQDSSADEIARILGVPREKNVNSN